MGGDVELDGGQGGKGEGRSSRGGIVCRENCHVL